MKEKFGFRNDQNEWESSFDLKTEEYLMGLDDGPDLPVGEIKPEPPKPKKKPEKLVFEKLHSLEEFYNPKLLFDRLKREGKL